MEEVEIKNIISKTLVEHRVNSNSRIERKIFQSLLNCCDLESNEIEMMLKDFVEPKKAKYINRYIITYLMRKDNLVKYLESKRNKRASHSHADREQRHSKGPEDLKNSADASSLESNGGIDALEKLKLLQNKIASRLPSTKLGDTNKILSTNGSLLSQKYSMDVNSAPNNFGLPDAVLKPRVTLSANKRMQDNQERSKQMQLKDNILKSSSSYNIVANDHLDSRIEGSKPNFRPQKQINFIDSDKRMQEVVIKEKKQKLIDLNRRIAESASKTGIADAARISYLSSKSEQQNTKIPSVEWWDVAIIHESGLYQNIDKINYLTIEQVANLSTITSHIEHPEILEPSNRSLAASGNSQNNVSDKKLTLTTKEAKRLRRQNRLESQKMEQEKIKLGLIEPPPPKVKMTNLMSVLTDNAIQDPTKMEIFVKEQSQKRLEKHLNSNAQRKLTKEQKSAKLRKKNTGGSNQGVYCCVFKIKILNNPAWRFKIEKNAEQLNLSGICAVTKSISVLAVEGGDKQIRKYKKLLLRRINFDDEKQQMINTKKFSELKPVQNNCVLVWEGKLNERCFKGFTQELYQSEMAAREVFRVSAVEHYWDLSLAYDLHINSSDAK